MKCTFSAWISGALLGLVSGCSGVSDREAAVANLHISPNVYVAQVGDTIESVAYRYRLSANGVFALNPGLGDVLRPGDRINVRAPLNSAHLARKQQATTEIQARYRPPSTDRRSTTRVQPRSTPAPRQEIVVSQVPRNARPIREDTVREEIITEIAPGNYQDAPATGRQIPRPAATERLPARNGWQWPIAGEVVRDYSPLEVNGMGIDVAGVPGQQVMASAAGTVIYASRDLSDSGNLVIIRHSDQVLSTYSHVKDLYVAEDDTVGAGDPIASLGWNSNRESVLHFEIRKDGKPLDPVGFLPKR